MAAVHNELRACTLCAEAGYAVAPGAVFSCGIRPRVLLIGQAPGVTEVETKRPFNAGSGRRLFQWLGEAGWEENAFRQTHYMTAVTKCYPGKAKNGKGDRVPSRAEQKLCRPHLARELALIEPRLILLVGKLAMGLLYPSKARLAETIGTAVYFPAPAPHLLEAQLADGQIVSRYAGQTNGRFVVPLPHPSGASLWPNKQENKRLIGRALALLGEIRAAWAL